MVRSVACLQQQPGHAGLRRRQDGLGDSSGQRCEHRPVVHRTCTTKFSLSEIWLSPDGYLTFFSATSGTCSSAKRKCDALQAWRWGSARRADRALYEKALEKVKGARASTSRSRRPRSARVSEIWFRRLTARERRRRRSGEAARAALASSAEALEGKPSPTGVQVLVGSRCPRPRWCGSSTARARPAAAARTRSSRRSPRP